MHGIGTRSFGVLNGVCYLLFVSMSSYRETRAGGDSLAIFRIFYLHAQYMSMYIYLDIYCVVSTKNTSINIKHDYPMYEKRNCHQLWIVVWLCAMCIYASIYAPYLHDCVYSNAAEPRGPTCASMLSMCSCSLHTHCANIIAGALCVGF